MTARSARFSTGLRAAWVLSAVASAALLALRAEAPPASLALAVPEEAPPPEPGRPSNVLREDYLGPESCKDCHEDKHRAWSAHPHRRMNQNPDASTVKGDFSGVSIEFQGGRVTFETEGARYFMTYEKGGRRVRRYVVTRTVGSKFMQFYVGKQVEGPEPAGSIHFTVEHKLSFGYWFRLKRWLPVTYFDPCGPEYVNGKPVLDFFDDPPVRPLYRETCLLCHNTYPYAYRAVLGEPFTGWCSEEVLRSPDLEAVVAGALPRREGEAITDVLDPDRHLVTLGVSCEACHFGGREHVRTGGDWKHAFLPSSPLLAVRDREPRRWDPRTVNGLCAQCHGAVNETYANGACTWNSREAVDLLSGACATAIRCTDCHDPHEAGPRENEDQPRQAQACMKCHPGVREGHGHHAGASCLDCHLPRATQGLEEVVRTHRISSPTDARMLAPDQWNACNLCHLDRPVSWTVAELERGWKKRVEPPVAWPDAPVGKVWLASERQAIRLLATQAYARSPLGRAALPELIDALEDPEAVNRTFAWFAVERVLGRSIAAEYDVTAAPEVRAGQVAALRSSTR